jgi:hypothetical protein
MIEAVGDVVIRRPSEAIIAFVTDLEQYKRADHKIGRVLATSREGDAFLMRHDGTLRGIPGPAVSLRLTVEGRSRVRYEAVPTFPSRLLLTFDGGFELTDVEGGTRVVHTERFRFRAPVRWVAEPFLRAWLANDVREEMARMKMILEAP